MEFPTSLRPRDFSTRSWIWDKKNPIFLVKFLQKILILIICLYLQICYITQILINTYDIKIISAME